MTQTMANLGDQELVGAEHQTMLDPHTCTRRGMCPVTQIRHQREPLESHSLYFEVHGNGPQKIIFIMGINDSSFAWLPQVNHFGKLEKYSTLVLDNRGVGMSGSPLGPYSTAGMAEDILCLLNYLQWTEDRSLHVVGMSLGGMIAQELAVRIPERISSLSLVVTHAGGSLWNNLPPLTACMKSMRVAIMPDLDKRIPMIVKMLFPKAWLNSVAEHDPESRTNMEVESEAIRRRLEVTKPQKFSGVMGQLAAALTHRMAPDRLAKVSASVPKVLILSAAEDLIIPHTGGETLKRHMPEAEYQCWEKTGHGICCQHKQRFNKLMETVFEQGNEGAAKRALSN